MFVEVNDSINSTFEINEQSKIVDYTVNRNGEPFVALVVLLKRLPCVQ